MVLISNGSMVLLKYKLNSVCDADNRPANGAQRTEYFLYTTIYCGCQYGGVKIMCQKARPKRNTHYLRIKCVLQAHRENNAYCVRIKSTSVIWMPRYLSNQRDKSMGFNLPNPPLEIHLSGISFTRSTPTTHRRCTDQWSRWRTQSRSDYRRRSNTPPRW